MAIANDIESANQQVGIQVTVKFDGARVGKEGDRYRQPDGSVRVWMGIEERKTESDNGKPRRTIKTLLSGVYAYKPSVGDRMVIDGVEYKMIVIEPASLGAEIYSYTIEGTE